MTSERNISIVKDADGKSIVIVNDIYFKGKRNINWDDVEKYLRRYAGEFIQMDESGDVIYLGSDFPSEFAGSTDTGRLRGTLAKAKANAAQGVPEMVEIASGKRFIPNYKAKHSGDAKYGWYRYDSRFALPVYRDGSEIERYNVFHVEILVRHSANGKLYLYDLVNIAKEASTPC